MNIFADPQQSRVPGTHKTVSGPRIGHVNLRVAAYFDFTVRNARHSDAHFTVTHTAVVAVIEPLVPVTATI
jgi:hypothetical protein